MAGRFDTEVSLFPPQLNLFIFQIDRKDIIDNCTPYLILAFLFFPRPTKMQVKLDGIYAREEAEWSSRCIWEDRWAGCRGQRRWESGVGWQSADQIESDYCGWERASGVLWKERESSGHEQGWSRPWTAHTFDSSSLLLVVASCRAVVM